MFPYCCMVHAADQRHERTMRGRAKVSVYTVAIDPMRPHIFATGSSDPLGMLSLGSLLSVQQTSVSAGTQTVGSWGQRGAIHARTRSHVKGKAAKVVRLCCKPCYVRLKYHSVCPLTTDRLALQAGLTPAQQILTLEPLHVLQTECFHAYEP